MSPVTLVTGARAGIGRFLSEYYVGQGHHVIGCSRSASDFVHERYTHYIADVADEPAIKPMFAAIRKAHGRLDHLINNAGVASMNHSLLTPLASVNAALSTNVVGTFLLSREAAKLMKKARYGRIVNFSTVAVPFRLAGEAAYVASKAAVTSLTQVLAREFADFGITVNCVAPGPIETDLIRAVPKAKIDSLIEQQALRRLGTFQDVVNTVDFFLRPQSDFITGQTIYLGGA